MDDEKLKQALEKTKTRGARSAHGIASDIGASTREVTHRLERMASQGKLKREHGDYKKGDWD